MQRAGSFVPLLMVVGAVAQYAGAAVAVHGFDRIGAAAVAWLRVLLAAVVLLAWRRPRWRAMAARQRRQVVGFGVALAVMNLAFYLAIDRLPLGTAVAIEFSGPIAVAASGSRRRRDLLPVGLAALGVVLLVDVRWRASAGGVLFALLAAVMWAAYIVAGRRVGGQGAASGIDGLALAMAAGSVAIAPFGVVGLVRHHPAGASLPSAVLLCAVVALCSNVIPYALDQVVLARLAASQFALLSTLLPVTAVLVGAVALAQTPTALELAGVALVVAALALRPGADQAPT